MDDKLSEQIHFRLTARLKRRALEQCRKSGVPLSTLLRRTLGLWVNGWNPFAQPTTTKDQGGQGDDR